MDKIRKIKELFKCKRAISLKWGFALYLPLCLIISYAGAMAIGVSTNYLQDWYRGKYSPQERYTEYKYEVYIDENNKAHAALVGVPGHYERNVDVIYWIISNTQVLLVPLWVMFCIAAIG
ncbi:MAG: hypothetical protein K2H23_05530, partial [Oscillospiraceae bacterium]|nr:hypothetical protein [Oscillospiraceae bacterium]